MNNNFAVGMTLEFSKRLKVFVAETGKKDANFAAIQRGLEQLGKEVKDFEKRGEAYFEFEDLDSLINKTYEIVHEKNLENYI